VPPVRRRPARAPQQNLVPWAILVTLFCCQILGIVAIVYSVQARLKAQAGNEAGALVALKNAKLWLWISLIAGLVFIGVFVVLVAAGYLTMIWAR
jgi:hypothetical protein